MAWWSDFDVLEIGITLLFKLLADNGPRFLYLGIMRKARQDFSLIRISVWNFLGVSSLVNTTTNNTRSKLI